MPAPTAPAIHLAAQNRATALVLTLGLQNAERGSKLLRQFRPPECRRQRCRYPAESPRPENAARRCLGMSPYWECRKILRRHSPSPRINLQCSFPAAAKVVPGSTSHGHLETVPPGQSPANNTPLRPLVSGTLWLHPEAATPRLTMPLPPESVEGWWRARRCKRGLNIESVTQ